MKTLTKLILKLLFLVSLVTKVSLTELDEDDTPTDQAKIQYLIYHTNTDFHSQTISSEYPKLRQHSKTNNTVYPNSILCLKVNVVQVSFTNGSEETDYNCEFFSKDVKDIEHYELPIQNLNEAFIQKREEAYANGLESVYILGGEVVNNEVILPENEEDSFIWFGNDEDKDTPGFSHQSRNLADKQFGVKTVLIVRITANGKSPFPTSKQLSHSVFGTPTSVNDITLNHQYKVCSNNKVSFQPATGKTTGGLTINNGVVDVNLQTVITDVYMLANFAKSEIGNINIYDHIMYDFPDGATYYSKTSWIGFAIVGGIESFYGTGSYSPRGGIWMTSSSMIVHEVAHNFGLMHSNQYNTEYEDTTCTMGFSNLIGYKSRCFNGAKMVELGWQDVIRTQVIEPLTDGEWEGKLIGIHDLNSNVNNNLSNEYKVVLEIKNSSSSTWNQPNLYVSYNRAEGITKDTGEHVNRVIIVEAIPGARKNMAWSKSNLIGNLGQRDVFKDTTFLDGRELQITVKKMGVDNGNIDYAYVGVKLKSETCTSDASCDDKSICSIDSCNLFTKVCSYHYKPNCCGNGICEVEAGESCVSCPSDCKLPNECSQVSTGTDLIARFGYEGFYIDMQAKQLDITIQSISFYAIPADPQSDKITVNVYTKLNTWIEDPTNTNNSWMLFTDSWVLTGAESTYTINNTPIYYYTVQILQHIPKYSRQAFYIIAEEDSVTFMHGGTSNLDDPVSTYNNDLILHDIGLANLPLFNDKHFIARRKFHGSILYNTHTTGLTPFQLFETRSQSFYIISSLSSTNSQWCLYARNNYLAVNSRLAITQCKNWNSLKWYVDADGKIHNLRQSSLCIQRTGKRTVLRNCKDGLPNQRWRYNQEKKLFSRNGEIGTIVENKGQSVTGNLFVNQQQYSKTTSNKIEEQWYLHSISSGIFHISLYTVGKLPFQIFLSTDDINKKYCLLPRSFSFVNGVKLTIQACETWKAYLWTMDSEGKLHSDKNDSKCITRRGKKLIIHSCKDGSKSQMWVYNLLDGHLSPIGNGQLSMTLSNQNIKNGVQVMSLQKDRNSLFQTWRLENVGS